MKRNLFLNKSNPAQSKTKLHENKTQKYDILNNFQWTKMDKNKTQNNMKQNKN